MPNVSFKGDFGKDAAQSVGDPQVLLVGVMIHDLDEPDEPGLVYSVDGVEGVVWDARVVSRERLLVTDVASSVPDPGTGLGAMWFILGAGARCLALSRSSLVVP